VSLALLGTLLVFVVLAVGADESWAATLAVIIAVAATAAVHWPTPSYRAFPRGAYRCPDRCVRAPGGCCGAWLGRKIGDCERRSAPWPV